MGSPFPKDASEGASAIEAGREFHRGIVRGKNIVSSRTDLSQLANGIWEIHAGCPSFLRVSSVAKIGYIPQFKASNARDQDEVSSDLARMGKKAIFERIC